MGGHHIVCTLMKSNSEFGVTFGFEQSHEAVAAGDPLFKETSLNYNGRASIFTEGGCLSLVGPLCGACWPLFKGRGDIL